MLPLALTMGEPAGIGGEITLKLWSRRDRATPVFFVVDDADRLRDLAQRLGLDVPVSIIGAPAESFECFPSALPVLPQRLAAPAIPGQPDPANGPATRAAIERAVAFVQAGEAAAIVTNPIHKKTLYAAGFSYPGHTEFLAALAGIETPPVMMLACPDLRVVPVTVHVSLADALKTLSTEAIVETARITADSLTEHFGIARPRLAVAGLNPHAGEDGSMGREEIERIAPAIAELRRQGVDAFGPVPPDALFIPRARRGYDAAVCMYHDQALIPLKALDVDGGVNVTLGLPFIRTSPDHGTAFDIAGTGRASESSLLAAIRMARDMADRRPASATGREA